MRPPDPILIITSSLHHHALSIRSRLGHYLPPNSEPLRWESCVVISISLGCFVGVLRDFSLYDSGLGH
jgi:hypothetical protein